MSAPAFRPLSRRTFLAGAAAFMPVAACANAPEVSAPPRPRPPSPAAGMPAARPDPGLSGRTGFALMDLASGEIVEAHHPDDLFLPASVTKVPTALYALETLGPAHRFATRLVATGPVSGGVLQGDLVLVGGGDPMLDTDALAELAAQAVQAGVRRIAGRFVVDGGALPGIAAIDPGQPVQAAYNPSVSGLNLNFNRVYLDWDARRTSREIVLEARAMRHSPAVRHVAIETRERSAPIFTWEPRGGGEFWTVARPALGPRGGRWLPVRDPDAYVADVFGQLASGMGLALPAPQVARLATGTGREIARVESPPLSEILRLMLRYSTNLTAEVAGLAASRQRGALPGSLEASAAAMGTWLRNYCAMPGPATGPGFANHSGLSDRTVITPRQTLAMLAAEEARAPGRLRALLRPVGLPEETEEGGPLPGQVMAKTGTLAFVRGLAGYVERQDGRLLAFAIYAGDLEARAGSVLTQERPSGSRAWIGRARAQERAVLTAWLSRYGSA